MRRELEKELFETYDLLEEASSLEEEKALNEKINDIIGTLEALRKIDDTFAILDFLGKNR